MTIEFRCTSCDKLLRTPAGTEGKQAKCPQCGAVMQVPAQSAFEAPPREPDFAHPQPESFGGAGSGFQDAGYQSAGYQDAGYQETANPYRPPHAAGASEPPLRGFHPTQIAFSDVFDKTWNIFKANLLMCVVGALVANLCMNVLQILIQALFQRLIENSGGGVAVVASIFQGLASLGVTTFFVFGMIKFFLGIARSGEANIGDLFSAGSLLLPGALLLFLLMVGTGVGMILLIVPGVLFLLFFAQAPFLMADRQMGVVDSLRYSAAAMSGNKMTVFVLYTVTWLAALAFTVLTCFIGGLLAWPFVSLLYAVTYLSVTGQSTAAISPLSAAQRPSFPPGTHPQA